MKKPKPFSTYDPFTKQEIRMLKGAIRTLESYFGECPEHEFEPDCICCNSGRVLRAMRDGLLDDVRERMTPEQRAFLREHERLWRLRVADAMAAVRSKHTLEGG